MNPEQLKIHRELAYLRAAGANMPVHRGRGNRRRPKAQQQQVYDHLAERRKKLNAIEPKP